MKNPITYFFCSFLFLFICYRIFLFFEKKKVEIYFFYLSRPILQKTLSLVISLLLISVIMNLILSCLDPLIKVLNSMYPMYTMYTIPFFNLNCSDWSFSFESNYSVEKPNSPGWSFSFESDSSETVNQPNSPGWTTLLGEQSTDSSYSVDGPYQSISTAASDASANPEVQAKKIELQRLIYNQFRHFKTRGRPRWQLRFFEEQEQKQLDWNCAGIMQESLEITGGAEEYEQWIEVLRRNPQTLYSIFREYL